MKFSRLFNALIIAGIPLTLNAKPNVLLMIADDMGLDASMCYNQGNQQAKNAQYRAHVCTGFGV